MLILKNLEDKRGKYRLQFAFFDESVHPFSIYQGVNYDLVRQQLPWESAAMHSPNFSYNLGPYEEVSVSHYVEKSDPDAEYWVYADIIAPTYEKCGKIVKNITEIQNVTKIVNLTYETKKNISYSKSLWKIIVELITLE